MVVLLRSDPVRVGTRAVVGMLGGPLWSSSVPVLITEPSRFPGDLRSDPVRVGTRAVVGMLGGPLWSIHLT